MTQLTEQVLELASQGKRDRAIRNALIDQYPTLTRHRVRVILGSEPSAEIINIETPLLVSFTLPDDRPPVYNGGPSLEERADAWENIDRSLQNHYWYLGATAADLQNESQYGQGAVERFAELVGKSPRRVYQLIQTYRAFEGKDVSGQLTFTHFQYAADSDKPDYWIRRAHEEQLPTRKLLELIKGKQLPEFRLHEPDIGNPTSETVRPVTETGYSDFPLDEPEYRDLEAPPGTRTEVAETDASLRRWYRYVRFEPCYYCGTTLNIEAAHIECLPSKKHAGLIPRRKGLGEWPCLPMCAEHSRLDGNSLAALGESAFFEQHRGYAHAIGYVTRLLLEFWLGEQ